jgi:hypothetical protein
MDSFLVKSTSYGEGIVSNSPKQGFMPGNGVKRPYSFPDFVVGIRICRIALATLLPLF